MTNDIAKLLYVLAMLLFFAAIIVEKYTTRLIAAGLFFVTLAGLISGHKSI